MKATVNNIDLENISREDAMAIRNELKALELVFNQDKYPKLFELDRILAGMFDSMVHNVHFISKRD